MGRPYVQMAQVLCEPLVCTAQGYTGRPICSKRPAGMGLAMERGNVPKVLQISKTSKERGIFPPRPPQGFGLTRKRVSAERSALAAAGRRPPPPRLELFHLQNFAHTIWRGPIPWSLREQKLSGKCHIAVTKWQCIPS